MILLYTCTCNLCMYLYIFIHKVICGSHRIVVLCILSRIAKLRLPGIRWGIFNCWSGDFIVKAVAHNHQLSIFYVCRKFSNHLKIKDICREIYALHWRLHKATSRRCLGRWFIVIFWYKTFIQKFYLYSRP